MKSYWWSIAFCLMFAMGLPACEDPTRVEPARHTQFDTLSWENFNGDQHKAWEEATQSWYENEYFACLQQYGFEVNCTDCTQLGITLEFKVDATGRIVDCKEISSKIYCSKHSDDEDFKVKDCLLNSFPKVVLPAPFHRTLLTVFVGRVPMC